MARGVFMSRTEAEGATLAEALGRYRREITPHPKAANTMARDNPPA